MAKKCNFIYHEIYQDLKSKIKNQELKPGQKLETEKELQEVYGVSRDTLRKALGKLEQEELIVRKAAIGTFVKRAKSNYGLTKMESFTEQMHQRGIKPSSELVAIELIKDIPEYICRELSIESDERCYKVCRIRKGDNEPMAYEIAFIPRKLCPDLQMYINDTASLYDIYENKYGLELKYGTVYLESEMPSPEIQNKLQISKSSPVLKMRCVMYLEDDQPLYYVECSYIGDKYFFSATIPRR